MRNIDVAFHKKEPLIMGIDIGTSACKVSLISTDTLKSITLSSSYPILTPKPLCVELDSKFVMNRVFNLIKKIASTKYSSRIEGIGLGGLVPSLIPVDKKGIPLFNCMTNMDKRAYLESEWMEMTIGRKRLYNIVFRSSMPKFLAPKILWIKKNFKDIYDRTYKFLQIKDLLAFYLCGIFSTDSLHASNTLLFDQNTAMWSDDLIQALEIDKDKLPVVYSPISIIGYLSKRASNLTGLKQGIPIVCGANDDALASLAIGGLKKDTAFETTGTSTVFGINIPSPVKDELQRFELGQGIKPNTYNISFVSQGTGAIIKWVVEELFNTKSKKKPAFKIFEDLEKEASGIEAGSEGLIFLPFFEGMGVGLHSKKAKGVICGLTLRHLRAHIYRAVLEGIALRLKENIEVLKEFKIQVKEVRTTGGGAKSKLFRQIKTDALALPYVLTDIEEAASVGAAIIAGGGVGIYEDPYSVGEHLATVVDIMMPRLELTQRYAEIAEASKQLAKCISG